MDMPHWWKELTTIPEAVDLKKLAQKIWASFNIPVVRCEALQNQDYTAPPSPQCLTRARFFPSDPSYQDVQWKPLLLTLAYAWTLQYWTEGVSLLASVDYCPLVLSVVELKWCMGRYITLSKQYIIKDLGSAIHETQGWNTGSPQVDPSPHPPQLVLKICGPILWKLIGQTKISFHYPGTNLRL